MDRKIETKPRKRRWLIIGLGSIVLLLVIYNIINAGAVSRLNVDLDKISIDTINEGTFQEFIPIIGAVQPLKTIMLDAVEGGRVEEKFIEDGSFVKKGDPILRLSNSDLLLDFMNREALLLDQMNNMRNTKIAMEQNHLQLKQQLLDIEFSYLESQKNYERSLQLYKEKVLAKAEFEKIEDSFFYLSNKRKLLAETVKKDSIFKEFQNEQLGSSVNLIQRNLEMVKQSLENLTVKAPISGQLTALNAEIGENKVKGVNLGQIDVLEGFKVRAGVDEHYISRVVIGQKGNFSFDGKTYSLVIKKILPQVNNGQFQVDMQFEEETPAGIKQGQTLQIKLALGDINKAVLVERGGFYQKTGGNWIYVIQDKTAFKREVSLGRQNPDYYEVLRGLKEGEVVITSSYDVFGEADELVINNDETR
jgi:HlyD family secretion protein